MKLHTSLPPWCPLHTVWKVTVVLKLCFWPQFCLPWKPVCLPFALPHREAQVMLSAVDSWSTHSEVIMWDLLTSNCVRLNSLRWRASYRGGGLVRLMSVCLFLSLYFDPENSRESEEQLQQQQTRKETGTTSKLDWLNEPLRYLNGKIHVCIFTGK